MQSQKISIYTPSRVITPGCGGGVGGDVERSQKLKFLKESITKLGIS